MVILLLKGIGGVGQGSGGGRQTKKAGSRPIGGRVPPALQLDLPPAYIHIHKEDEGVERIATGQGSFSELPHETPPKNWLKRWLKLGRLKTIASMFNVPAATTFNRNVMRHNSRLSKSNRDLKAAREGSALQILAPAFRLEKDIVHRILEFLGASYDETFGPDFLPKARAREVEEKKQKVAASKRALPTPCRISRNWPLDQPSLRFAVPFSLLQVPMAPTPAAAMFFCPNWLFAKLDGCSCIEP